MKPSADLHILIKSLTKGEKIFFKKYSRRHVTENENKYVKLFDIIDGIEGEYDEKLVLRSFGNDSYTKQIHVAKNYLFELILQALSIYNSEKDTENELFEYLKKIKILIGKNLPKAALRLLQKAKVEAISNSSNHILYQLYEYEALITARKYTGEAQKELQTILDKKEGTLRQLTNTSIYKSYNLMLNLISARWSYGKDPKELEMIKEILNKPQIKNENIAEGFASKYELYGIKLRAYRFLLEDEKSLFYRKRVVELLEEHPDIINRYPEKYIARLHDLIIFILGTGSTQFEAGTIEQYFCKLKEHLDIILKSRKSLVVKASSWVAYYQLRIGYYYSNLKREEFDSLMTEVKKEINIFGNSLRTRYLFDFYLFIIISYFEFGEYELSQEWLLKYINHKDAEKYEELYNTMLMFSIILHYELGNFELVESLINNTKRYYKKKDKLYDSELLLLKYLRELTSANKDESLVIFKRLSIELEVLSKKESEKRFLNSFDFRRWVGRKIGKAEY